MLHRTPAEVPLLLWLFAEVRLSPCTSFFMLGIQLAQLCGVEPFFDPLFFGNTGMPLTYSVPSYQLCIAIVLSDERLV